MSWRKIEREREVLGGVKREDLNRLGWKKSVRSFVGLRWLGAGVCC